jgi:single-stranded DNA-specific DHH superfamily exonuclease
VEAGDVSMQDLIRTLRRDNQRLIDDIDSEKRKVEFLESDTRKKNEDLMQKIKEMDELKSKYEEQMRLFNSQGSAGGLNTSQRV